MNNEAKQDSYRQLAIDLLDHDRSRVKAVGGPFEDHLLAGLRPFSERLAKLDEALKYGRKD